MHIEDSVKLDFRDVLIRPKRSKLNSRKEVDITREFTFKHSGKTWHGVPIMASNMDGVGVFGMAQALQREQMFTCMVKSYDRTHWAFEASRLDLDRVAVSTGTSDTDSKRLRSILTTVPLKFICIDVANGYSEHFGDFVAQIREAYPGITIIAGNVVTADMTQELILRGADIVKVGIGPGAVCTTRIQTGVGYPQLSAIMECADAAHGLGGHIIADGGCTCPGDVAKAFGAGADFVMLGGMLAGHDEGGGEIQKFWEPDGTYIDLQPHLVEKSYVEFYGMSSETAMKKHHGGMADYRSSEGRTVRVPYRGAVEATVRDILGGLRSTMTYTGAAKLKDLSKCTTFVRVNNQYNAWLSGK